MTARLHGVDAVRAFALTLGVVLHATMSFLPGPTIWVVGDATHSITLAVTFFVIHALRMATFFFIAGFFARLLYHRLGAAGFLRDRLKRIGVPLMLWWPLTLAGVIAIAVAGSNDAATAAQPALSVDNFPLTHLWFLYVLLWLYAAALLVRGVLHVMDRGAQLQRATDIALRQLLTPWGVAALAIPVAWALYQHPYWLMWFGVPTPDMSLRPNRAALFTYGAAFAIGWAVQRQQERHLPQLRRWWAWHAALAIAATTACLVQLGPQPVLFPAPFGMEKARYAATYAIAIWGWVFALLGIGLRFFDRASPRMRYLADASYWIYLTHLPVVMALQLVVATWPITWWIKLPLIVGVAMAVLLLTYRWGVRHTGIGALLNGRRYPRTPVVIPSP